MIPLTHTPHNGEEVKVVEKFLHDWWSVDVHDDASHVIVRITVIRELKKKKNRAKVVM